MGHRTRFRSDLRTSFQDHQKWLRIDGMTPPNATVPLKVRWGPSDARPAGIRVWPDDSNDESFISWTDLQAELQRQLLPQLFANPSGFKFETRDHHGKSRSGWYRCSMIEATGFVMCGLATIPTTAGVSMVSCDWETPSQHLTHGKRISDIRTARTDAFPLVVPISINSDARNSPKLTAPRFYDLLVSAFRVVRHGLQAASACRLPYSQ
jgi:hypothetical protein